jgi:hypothetical protein
MIYDIEYPLAHQIVDYQKDRLSIIEKMEFKEYVKHVSREKIEKNWYELKYGFLRVFEFGFSFIMQSLFFLFIFIASLVLPFTFFISRYREFKKLKQKVQ